MNDKLMFNFTLGKKCNLRCKFCYNKTSSYVELTLNDVLHGYSQIKDLDCALSFIGGEPLVYGWFRACLNMPKPKEVFTNGVLLDETFLRYRDVLWIVSPHTEELRRKGIELDYYIAKLRKLQGLGMRIELSIIGTDPEVVKLVETSGLRCHVVLEYDEKRQLHGVDNVIKYGPRYLYKGKEITVTEALTKAYTGCRIAFFEYDMKFRKFVHECKRIPFSTEFYESLVADGLSCNAGECWLDCYTSACNKNELIVTRA